MKIFITGASGFIGGAIARHLHPTHELVAMARSRESAEKILALGINAINCSLSTVTPNHVADCQAVIHAAAFVSASGSREQFWQTNVAGTKRLTAAASLAGARRFIHISTESVLFHGQPLRSIDESYPYPEKTPFLYSETKAEAERLVLAANQPDQGFATIALRPRLVWGPGDQTILPVVTHMAQDGGFFWFNNGEALTSTAYIDNVVHAVELALTARANGKPYFITDDEIWCVKDFLTAYAATQGITLPNRSLPAGPMRLLGRFTGGVWRLFNMKSEPPLTELAVAAMSADCTLKIDNARKDLGYKPILTVAQGLEKMKNQHPS
ncbi:MAG: NAD-dependent epimerase/dehydratase family protein [Candidatus Promineifilaceae bacterium]